jgi:amino acid transporter
MAEVLEYATALQGPYRPGIGYYILITVNIAALGSQCALTFGEISSDRYAGLIGYVVGGSLLVLQLAVAAIPATIYAARQWRRVKRRSLHILLWLAWASAVFTGLGIILSMNLPSSMRLR